MRLTGMSDEELDALFARAQESMLRTLNERIDTEAMLREVLRKAGGRSQPYADDHSPAGEVTEREEPA